MAWDSYFIFIGACFWIMGFIRVGKLGEKGSPLYVAFVRPPTILYIACGMPKSHNIPRGVMAVSSLLGQLEGLLLMSYGLIYPYLPNQNIIGHGFFLLIATVVQINMKY
jgi:hypothetical protein